MQWLRKWEAGSPTLAKRAQYCKERLSSSSTNYGTLVLDSGVVRGSNTFQDGSPFVLALIDGDGVIVSKLRAYTFGDEADLSPSVVSRYPPQRQSWRRIGCCAQAPPRNSCTYTRTIWDGWTMVYNGADICEFRRSWSEIIFCWYHKDTARPTRVCSLFQSQSTSIQLRWCRKW